MMSVRPSVCLSLCLSVWDHHQYALTVLIPLTLCYHLSYQPSLLVSPLDDVQCPLRIDECQFLLVGVHKRMSHEIVLTFPRVSRMSCSSYWDGLWDDMYSCCFLGGCCFQDLLKKTCDILGSSHLAWTPGISLKSKYSPIQRFDLSDRILKNKTNSSKLYSRQFYWITILCSIKKSFFENN